MKKQDMQDCRDRYLAKISCAHSEEKEGFYRNAVKSALDSWDDIDGMMQYERRYGDTEFSSIEAIDLVLKYAPFLLDYPSLNILESLLKDFRRIEKNTSDSLTGKLAEARSLMWETHRLWNHLEFHPHARQDELRDHLGSDQDRWQFVANNLEMMGLLRRTADGQSYRLSLCTRMGKMVSAKCPSCGAVTEAPKAMFLENMTCPDCRAAVSFVLLVSESVSG